MLEENKELSLRKTIIRLSVLVLFWSILIAFWIIFTPFYMPFLSFFAAYHIFIFGLHWGAVPRKYYFIFGSTAAFSISHIAFTKLACFFIDTSTKTQSLLSGRLIFCPGIENLEYFIDSIVYALILFLSVGGEEKVLTSKGKRKREEVASNIIIILLFVVPLVLTILNILDWRDLPLG